MNVLLKEYLTKYAQQVKDFTKSKPTLNIETAIEKGKGLDITSTEDECFIQVYEFLKSKPLKNNQFYHYGLAYENDEPLNIELFNYDLDKLQKEFDKIDSSKAKAKEKGKRYSSRFSKSKYEDYVLFMMLKLKGFYKPEYDAYFGVKKVNQFSREYNPLANLPSVLRSSLPVQVKEFDISRAFPTFIDKQLGIKERKEDVYSLIDKVKFNMLLNIHKGTKNANIDDVRAQLKPIYGDRVNEVITEERFNESGRLFREFERLETITINEFVKVNQINHFVRLHDGVFVLANIDDSNFQLNVEGVNFKVKECIAPKKVKDAISFYSFDEKGKVRTSIPQYTRFFKSQNYIRVQRPKEDKLIIFKDSRNVVKPYAYNNNINYDLQQFITHTNYDEVAHQIGLDNRAGHIKNGFRGLPVKELKFYRDTYQKFGLYFKNGVFHLSKKENNKFEIQSEKPENIDGFFDEHITQTRKFEYTEEVGDFEDFVSLVSIGKRLDKDATEEELQKVKAFASMIGYMSTNYKDTAECPAIILSDEGADEEKRDGSRGKTIMLAAFKEIRNYVFHDGGKEQGDKFAFSEVTDTTDLVLTDDTKASFNWHEFYVRLTGDMKVEAKFSNQQTIPFEKSPKFLFTTNYIFNYQSGEGSTERRFAEYKFCKYFSNEHTPKDEFNGRRLYDENSWDEDEWNRFYSFIFRCVHIYFKNGLINVKSDKTNDRFRVLLGWEGDVKYDEFERCFNKVTSEKTDFSVTDILKEYKSGVFAVEKWFHKNNLKEIIGLYLEVNKIKNITRNDATRRYEVIQFSEMYDYDFTPVKDEKQDTPQEENLEIPF